MKKQFAALVAVPLICMTVEAHARYNTYDTKAYNAMREMVKEVKSLQVNYAAAAGTPEDSVIFYGGFTTGTTISSLRRLTRTLSRTARGCTMRNILFQLL